MQYPDNELQEIERVKRAFSNYLDQCSDSELVWSKKVGYIWLILTQNPYNPVDTGRRIESAIDLCRTCLYDIAMGVVCMKESDHMPESADEMEQQEIKRRWKQYIDLLPEYAYLCDEVLENEKVQRL